MNAEQGPQGPLEDRVRRALHDDRWRLPVDDEMLDRVHAGAARRRRRRQAGTAVGAALLVVGGLGFAGYLTGPLGGSDIASTAQGQAGSEVPDASESERSGPGNDAELRSTPSSPASGEPEQLEKTQGTLETTAPESLAGMPDTFRTASITAIAPERFWLLGDTGSAAAVAVTDDGGATFAQVGTIDAQVAGEDDAGPGTVHDLRFADASNGWAYGGSLWTTHDGGRSWTRTTEVPGQVTRLEADNGFGYALARSGGRWTVWRAPVGTDDWTQLDVDLENASDLAVTESSIAVTGRSGSTAYAMVSEDGGETFEQRPTPCVSELSAGDLSAAAKTLWLACPTGMSSAFSYSDDNGVTWQEADVDGEAPPNSSVVGARTGDEAVVAMNGEIRTVDGRITTLGDLGTPVFAGFTTPQVGYVLDVDGHLFRTTDAGVTWSPVEVE